MKTGYVYILTNKRNGTLYIGVTSDLIKRIYEHKQGLTLGFATRHGLKKLVYFEQCADISGAIEREKRLKKWKRAWKLRLIEKANPEWDDLYDSIIGEDGFLPAQE